MTEQKIPDGALIEIIERGDSDLDFPQVVIPNEVRINGVPILMSGDDEIIIHENRIGVDGREMVKVTMTMFARRVVIGAEGVAK